MHKTDFFFPRARYYGQIKPENLLFNANLQEFSQRVSIICSLETAGKISPGEAFCKIEALWEQLQCSKEQLGIGDAVFDE